MKKLTVFLFAAFVGLVSPLSGQRSTAPLPPLPDGPLVRLRAPDVSRWIVTYNPKRGGSAEGTTEGGGNQASFGKRVVYTKNKDLILEQVVVPNRPVRDRWIIGPYQYSKDNQSKRYVPYTASSFPTGILDPYFYIDLSKTDFPGFEWIAKDNYTGLQKMLNRDCIIYTQTDGGNATAYVDLATRYPVLLRNGNNTIVFEFQRGAQISLPPEIQQDFDARSKRVPSGR